MRSGQREEAILNLEVKENEKSRLYIDAIVRYSIPNDDADLRAAANQTNIINSRAEADKRARYSKARSS